jgi:copper(I)-binding protein
MKLFKQIAFASALTIAAFLDLATAHAHETKIGDIVITHPWSRQSPMAADVGAGFMVIQNNGQQDDRLVSATATISDNVQLHDMKMVDDVMKMVELAGGIPIPAGAKVELKPGSLHVMFMELKTPVKEGETFAGTLTFEKAGTVDVAFEVAAPNAGMN